MAPGSWRTGEVQAHMPLTKSDHLHSLAVPQKTSHPASPGHSDPRAPWMPSRPEVPHPNCLITCTDTSGYLNQSVMLKVSLFPLKLQSYRFYFKKSYPSMQKMTVLKSSNHDILTKSTKTYLFGLLAT